MGLARRSTDSGMGRYIMMTFISNHSNFVHDMKRAAEIGEFWNWLPAFRAVAELEHLPSAAKQMSVSASALSRSVRLLEAEVGTPLFDREGRNLVLNDSGILLLDAVLEAMRGVHSSLEKLRLIGRGRPGPRLVAAPLDGEFGRKCHREVVTELARFAHRTKMRRRS